MIVINAMCRLHIYTHTFQNDCSIFKIIRIKRVFFNLLLIELHLDVFQCRICTFQYSQILLFFLGRECLLAKI